MKKHLLLILAFFLTGCSTGSLPYCEEYETKTKFQTTKLFLKDGILQKEIKTKNNTQSQKGLFTFQDNTLNLFIKDKKETYHLEDKDLISITNPEKKFFCH